WPIITDHNIESTNFLAAESRENLDKTAKLVEENEVVTIGGFIGKSPDSINDHPIKIVTGKENCAIFKIETNSAQKLLVSLEKDKRYSEYVILSPFTKDGVEFSRILFLDGDYVKRNEKYLLGFDPLASITYNRGVITLIGDEMWRVQQVASRTSAKIGEAGLNILNMDAQEETSRIIIVVEDSKDNIRKAIKAIHKEKSEINFI